jgi:hypothetical protein
VQSLLREHVGADGGVVELEHAPAASATADAIAASHAGAGHRVLACSALVVVRFIVCL